MRLSTFCILCCLSAGISQAATYVWSGAAGNGIYGDSNNWTVDGAPNGYFPQHSTNDNAIIGENAGTVTWSTAQSFFGATNTVQVGSGSTLVCTTTIGDLNVNSFTLEGNSHLVFESSNAFGLGRDFTLDSAPLRRRNTVPGPLRTSPTSGPTENRHLHRHAGYEQPFRKRND